MGLKSALQPRMRVRPSVGPNCPVSMYLIAVYGRPCHTGAQTNNIRRYAVLKVSDEIQSEIMRPLPVGN